MHILAVLAHPSKTSTSGSLFYQAVAHLQQLPGVTVDVLDLYDHADRIPFYRLPAAGQPIESAFADAPFFAENKARFMAADRLLLVYPVWWYAVPAIMKAWLDLVTNYAFASKGPNRARARHKIKKALIINTASMTWWYRLFFTRNSATEMVKQACRFMDIKQIKVHEINGVRGSGQKKCANLGRVLSLCAWLAT